MAKSTSKLFKEENPEVMKEDAMNIPEENEKKEEVKEKFVSLPKSDEADDIQDLNLSAIKKKRFRINGDSNKILELNTSDLTITSRLSKSYERLTKYMDEVGKILSKLPDGEDEVAEVEDTINEQLKAIDDKMRKEIDFIFDAPVSKVCADGGSMYDPFEGMFRFEHIIDALSKLYETNLNSEFSKMKKRVSAKTSKYTKKYHN